MQAEKLTKVVEFNSPQMDILETTAQRVLMHCGVGIGKSYDIGMLAFDFVAFNPEVRGFIGANTYGQLTKSTLDRVFTVWEQIYGYKKNIHYVVDRIPPESFLKVGQPLKTYENTICFHNGAVIFLASLDNYKVIDGTEFGWALLDETKDTKEVAVKEVIIARLRQLGMMIDSGGKIHKTLKYNKDTGIVENLLEMRLKDGTWVYDKATNKYHIVESGRELLGYTPLYIFTSPAKTRWLMEWFKLDEDAEEIEKSIYSKTEYYRKRKGDQLVVIASTYHNEKNLSPGYIERMINDLGDNDGRVKMLIYGSPFGKTGGEYYHAYRRLIHVGKFEPWPDETVHLSFDFNSQPYMTCTCWQMKFIPETGRYDVRCFDEFCLPNPKNNTPDLCDEIIKKYGHLLKNGMFYYGDYSGKSSQTITKEFKHQYKVIESWFKGKGLMETSDRVIVNPLHVKRRPFMNKALAGKLPFNILIHEQCRELRGDLEFVKEGKTGDKLKTLITDENTGATYQEHGHTSDAADYFLCSVFNDLFNK